LAFPHFPQPYLQLPKISSYFDAMPLFILNDHAFACNYDVDEVSSSPDGDAVHSKGLLDGEPQESPYTLPPFLKRALRRAPLLYRRSPYRLCSAGKPLQVYAMIMLPLSGLQTSRLQKPRSRLLLRNFVPCRHGDVSNCGTSLQANVCNTFFSGDGSTASTGCTTHNS